MTRRSIIRSAAASLPLLLAAGMPQIAGAAGLGDVNHIIVIYLENRSFDNLYGSFPGADGLANAGAAATQVDKDGKPYARLPQPIDTNRKPPAPDQRFPANLPNKPFEIDKYVQIDGGKMDKFAAYSDSAGLAMGYYDGSHMKLWDWAKRYTLADHFFHAAFGGSFLNHIFLVCACVPRYENAPKSLIATLDADGNLVMPGPDQITPDGYAVNTMQSINQPHSSSITDPAKLLPEQDMNTIGDELSDKGIDWVWYSGGWNDAIAGHPDKLFQFHHQPFAYFKKYADGTSERAKHLKDETDLEKAIADGSLPPVPETVRAQGQDEENPQNIDFGEAFVAQVVEAVTTSPQWPRTLLVWLYDEHGGYWDHVAPPKGDRWGPGARVPTLIISPFARKDYVDHTVYDTSSILKLIETRFGIAPLGPRDRDAGDLTNALQF